MKQDIRNLSLQELSSHLNRIGEKPFRAKQVFDWLYKKCAGHFEEMANLPPALRAKLSEDFFIQTPEIEKHLTAKDQTQKFLFDLPDHEKVETVLIPTRDRSTVCVSTQAGCKFGCKFCASGIGGWTRDLTPAEILSQIIYAKQKAEESGLPPVSHLVFMGTGEPLDNYDNVLKAIRTINAPEGINIGARRITVSTCGVIPQIQRLAGEGLQIELAISLHGFNDESRKVLMPVNKKYPMGPLVEAVRKYIGKTNRQVTFEYILIKDFTCSTKAAEELGALLKGMIVKMNLIPYNPVKEFDHQPPTEEDIRRFQRELKRFGIHSTVRTPRGRDVAAACGQLRHNSKK